jgi:hypothetical protein
MEITNVTDLFPSRKFLIEVDFKVNEETSAKLLESAIKGTEILPGLTISKIYPKVATVDDIAKKGTKAKIESALKYLDDVKRYIQTAIEEYKYTELQTEDFNVIQKFNDINKN